MKFSDMHIPFNHATRTWEVWHEGEDEKMEFLGTAPSYSKAKRLAKEKAGH